MADPNEKDSSPIFLSKNRLKEIFASDPRLAESPEAQDIFIKQSLEHGDEIEGLNAKFDFGETVKNIPDSAKELGMSIAHVVKNPLASLKGISTATTAAIRNFAPDWYSNLSRNIESAVPEALGGSGLSPEKQKERDENVYNGVVDTLITERYGSLDRALNTIEKDPVGFVSDAATLLTAGGAGSAKLGANLSRIAPKTARALAKTSEVLNRVGNTIDPVNIAVEAGAKLPVKMIKAANEATGVNKLIARTHVGEAMSEGLGLTPTQQGKLAGKLKRTDHAEELAKLGVTGTLPEMSEQLQKIASKSKSVLDKSFEDISAKTAPIKLKSADNAIDQLYTTYKGNSEKFAGLTKSEGQKIVENLKLQPVEQVKIAQKVKTNDIAGDLSKLGINSTDTPDVTLNRLTKAQETAAQELNKRAAGIKGRFKVQSADKAVDELYRSYGGSLDDITDLFKKDADKIAENLGLSPSETYRISNKTLTDDIGKRLENLGIKKDDDLASIGKELKLSGNQSKTKVDRALASVPERYKTKLANKILLNLQRLKGSIPFKNLAEDLQKQHNRIVQLIVRNENHGLNLSELNETKRLLDNIAGDKVFTQAGDYKTSNIGENLGKLRKEVRGFIENAADEYGIKNIRDLNNDTQFARELEKIIEKKIKSGAGSAKEATTGEKLSAVEFQALREQLKDLRLKNKEKGLSAAELNQLDNMISAAFSKGLSGSTKLNLESLQKEIRGVINFTGKRQNVSGFDELRKQVVLAEETAKEIDKKIKSRVYNQTEQSVQKLSAERFESIRNEIKDLKIKNTQQGLSPAELNQLDDKISEALSSGIGGTAKINLEALRDEVRASLDVSAQKQSVNNTKQLRQQVEFAQEYKKLIDAKIARGGDKVAKSRALSKQILQTIFGEILYRSKIGKLYGAAKGAAGIFQTLRGPQFERDLATAVQLLKDGQFKKLEGGFSYARTPSKTETKLLAKKAGHDRRLAAIQQTNAVLNELSKAYPALRGIRLTGLTAKAVEDEQANKSGRSITPETPAANELRQ